MLDTLPLAPVIGTVQENYKPPEASKGGIVGKRGEEQLDWSLFDGAENQVKGYR